MMTPEQFDREKKYQAALAIARSLRDNGIIDDDDYAKTEAILREKFSPLLGAFISEKLDIKRFLRKASKESLAIENLSYSGEHLDGCACV